MGHTIANRKFEQHTGAVSLFFAGKRTKLKSGREIIALASKTKFLDRKSAVASRKDGSIRFTPRDLVPNATHEAMVNGLLLSKITVEGKPGIMPVLMPGTYYLFVDFLPGGESSAHEGRWIGRMVGAGGRIACSVVGIEVKQIVAFGSGKKEPPGKAGVMLHGMPGISESGDSAFLANAAGSGWTETQGNWLPIGVGCVRDVFCAPNT